jgi:hypothetical protein
MTVKPSMSAHLREEVSGDHRCELLLLLPCLLWGEEVELSQPLLDLLLPEDLLTGDPELWKNLKEHSN